MLPLSSWDKTDPKANEISLTNTRLEHLLDKIAQSRHDGNPISAQSLIEANPELDAESAVRLIYEEICLKYDDGEMVHSKEILQKFPKYHNQLATVLGFERLLNSASAEPVFPKPGETIGPFQLIRKLGQGASGCTYLALEQSLGDRLVVIKVVPDDQEEHLALSRLQHTNIMPLYSERVIADRGLRLLCMPYLGGTGFDHIHSLFKEKSIQSLLGTDILNAIDSCQPPDSDRRESMSPARVFLAKSSFPDAIAFIGVSLADAAHEAHSRGLVHMDIKPSNVLISADAQPLLLDFHLARKPVHQGDDYLEKLGGTNGWMSPEQARCFQFVQRGYAAPCDIDGRSDIYSIGLLMATSLKMEVENKTAVRKYKQGISIGLADIITKCLAVNPLQRYQSAALLADDLRRHLNFQPLNGVRNRSLMELWGKWRNRNPSGQVWLAASLLLIPLIIISAFMAFKIHGQTIESINNGLADSRKLLKASEFDSALQRLNQLRLNSVSTPGLKHYQNEIDTAIAITRRKKLSEQLNRLIELIRSQSAGSELTTTQIQSLTTQCHSVWDRRAELLQKFAASDPEEPVIMESAIRSNLESLALILSDLIFKTVRVDSRTESKVVLDQTEQLLGQSFTIALARRSSISAEPEPCKAALETIQIKPSSAAEFNQLGRFEVEHQHFTYATEPLRKAVYLDPSQFWFHFDLARNAYQISQFEEALAEWTAAIALRPNSAVSYYNRGLTWGKLGHANYALINFKHALEIEPSMAEASFQKGLNLSQSGEKISAIESLVNASSHASNPKFKSEVLFQLALLFDETGQVELSTSTAEKSAKLGSNEALNWLRKHRR